MPAVVSSGSGTTLPVPGAAPAGARGLTAGAPGDFGATLATLLAPVAAGATSTVSGAGPLAALPSGATGAGPGDSGVGGVLGSVDLAGAGDTDGSHGADSPDASATGALDPNQSLAQQVPLTLVTSAAAAATATAPATGGVQGVAADRSSTAAAVTAPDAARDAASAPAAPAAGSVTPAAAGGGVSAPDGSAAAAAAAAAGQAPADSAAPLQAGVVPVRADPSLVTTPVTARPAAQSPTAADAPGTPGAQAVAAVATPVAPTFSVVTGPPPAPSAPALTPQPFAEQLSRPVLRLAAGAPGEHVLTVRVSPEHLGPVTVQAHIGADGVRIELFSATDAGRAAVHAALSDLRRDLAGTGLGASLDLSHRGAPGHDPSSGNPRGEQGEGGAAAQGRDDGRPAPASRVAGASGPGPHTSTPSQPSPTVAVLDVLA